MLVCQWLGFYIWKFYFMILNISCIFNYICFLWNVLKKFPKSLISIPAGETGRNENRDAHKNEEHLNWGNSSSPKFLFLLWSGKTNWYLISLGREQYGLVVACLLFLGNVQTLLSNGHIRLLILAPLLILIQKIWAQKLNHLILQQKLGTVRNSTRDHNQIKIGSKHIHWTSITPPGTTRFSTK